MNQTNKLILALVLIVLAAGFFYRSKKAGENAPDLAFFYDESAKKLFTAARTMVPPIQGTDGPQEDAFRAMVVSKTGQPKDKKSWEVVYLEKYSPELKKQMEAAKAVGSPPLMSRAESLEHRFVRRLADPTWYPMSSPEAEQITTDWANPGPNGVTPVPCTP